MTWSYIQKRPYFKLIFLGGIPEYIKAILLKIKRMAFKKVPTTGFEPAHLLAPPPQDGMSTNFTTWAFY